MRYHLWVPGEELPASELYAAGVKALLESLKVRIGATVVGILDGSHGRLHASSEDSGGGGGGGPGSAELGIPAWRIRNRRPN
jgi:hypothetical protein